MVLCLSRNFECWKFFGSFLCMVCLIMCGLVKLISVCGLVMLMLFSIVKEVEILLVVGWVSIEMYGSLVLCSLFSVVEVLVICISENRFFCMWVLLFCEKYMQGVLILIVVFVVSVKCLLIIEFIELFMKVKLKDDVISVWFLSRLCMVISVLYLLVFFCVILMCLLYFFWFLNLSRLVGFRCVLILVVLLVLNRVVRCVCVWIVM